MVLLGLFPMVARADRDEWRLGFTGTGLWTTIDYAGSRASLATPGCGVRMSFGVMESLELGARLDVGFAPVLEFREAVVEGDEGNLVAVETSQDVRATEARDLSHRRKQFGQEELFVRAGILGCRPASPKPCGHARFLPPSGSVRGG